MLWWFLKKGKHKISKNKKEEKGKMNYGIYTKVNSARKEMSYIASCLNMVEP
jgi:hypothetical protein